MKKIGRLANRIMAAELASMLAVSIAMIPAFGSDTFEVVPGVEDSMYDTESLMEDNTFGSDETADQPLETDSSSKPR